jgi:hypothetical protein
MNKYLPHTSLMFSLEIPVLRFLHLIGTTAYEYPGVIDLRGISTVKLKWWEIRGEIPSITVFR